LAEISVVGLERTYPGASRPAIKNLSFEVARGEFFGLLGPNGAGKTTTISILCGLLRPTAGHVEVRGERWDGQSRTMPRGMGLVPQDIALYPTLTVRENLDYFGRMSGLWGGDLRRRVDRCLHIGALESHASRRVVQCSGGVKRRANLAAGLLSEPPILVLDEPTVGVDAQSRNVLIENLKAINQSGTTIVYTTHYMEEAEALCTRIAILDAGGVIAQGEPAELIARQKDCSSLVQLFLALTGKELRE